jgi:hypothetical protein
LIIIAVTVAVFFFNEESMVENILGLSIGWVVLAFLLLIFWNYRDIHFTINDENLLVTYGRFDKSPSYSKMLFHAKKPQR